MALATSPIRKIAKRMQTRLSKDAIKEIRETVSEEAERVAEQANRLAVFANRRTVLKQDVEFVIGKRFEEWKKNKQK